VIRFGCYLSCYLIGFAVAGGALWATPKPENVLVVVNEPSAISRRITDYYTKKRGIPPLNVCALRTTTDEHISRTVFDGEISKPIANCLKSRKLQEQILYIVTTAGVPLVIDGLQSKEGDYASVDSELTLLYSDMKGTPHSLAGPVPNPFFGHQDSPFSHPQFPIYLVTRLTGYDFADVKAMIDKAQMARNRGKFVIDLRSSEVADGNSWLRTAALLLPKDRVVLEETDEVLYHQKDVIGFASWGSNDKNRHQRLVGFEWLPGAIMTEFVSTNGRTFKRPPDSWNISTFKDTKLFWADSPQTLTADYIHEGATGASGHTDEPYLRYCPRPDYLLPAYFAGRNLAESYYLAIMGLSWQNIVVGDPLCSLGKP
jgi:uncharacterized protein (TIGR03790 family)